MDYVQHYESPIGTIVITSDGEALTGLWFSDWRFAPELLETSSCPVLEETKRWLDIYFSGRDPGFTPALRMDVTPFRSEVYKLLLEIPFGETTSYGEIAKVLARRRGLDLMSAQAVGGAVGHNPISLIVPCHRVIGSDGSLIGYEGGLDKKRWLLAMEQRRAYD